MFLDLHGAMVIEDCDDAEGEIVSRIRRIAPSLPIAVTLDYHTNLSGDLVEMRPSSPATRLTRTSTCTRPDGWRERFWCARSTARSSR